MIFGILKNDSAHRNCSGPGCSSMIGLFQENGPCHFVNGSKQPSLNPYSFNEFANTIYVDQPIGSGFSYGTSNVGSTESAAPYVWKLLQAFYDLAPQYESHEFGIFTESYGGHFGPSFARYIVQQNAGIAAGNTTGHNINITALAVNNGWFDPSINYKAQIDYAYNNSYKPLLSASSYRSLTDLYNTGCVPLIQTCASTGTNTACLNALSYCSNYLENTIGNSGDFDPYDIRQPANDPYPPSTYADYLKTASVTKAIGAQSTYTQCADGPNRRFSNSGDRMYTYSLYSV